MEKVAPAADLHMRATATGTQRRSVATFAPLRILPSPPTCTARAGPCHRAGFCEPGGPQHTLRARNRCQHAKAHGVHALGFGSRFLGFCVFAFRRLLHGHGPHAASSIARSKGSVVPSQLRSVVPGLPQLLSRIALPWGWGGARLPRVPGSTARAGRGNRRCRLLWWKATGEEEAAGAETRAFSVAASDHLKNQSNGALADAT